METQFDSKDVGDEFTQPQIGADDDSSSQQKENTQYPETQVESYSDSEDEDDSPPAETQAKKRVSWKDDAASNGSSPIVPEQPTPEDDSVELGKKRKMASDDEEDDDDDDEESQSIILEGKPSSQAQRKRMKQRDRKRVKLETEMMRSDIKFEDYAYKMKPWKRGKCTGISIKHFLPNLREMATGEYRERLFWSIWTKTAILHLTDTPHARYPDLPKRVAKITIDFEGECHVTFSITTEKPGDVFEFDKPIKYLEIKKAGRCDAVCHELFALMKIIVYESTGITI